MRFLVVDDSVTMRRIIINALQRIGYHGAISVEHEPETFDPSDDLRAMREQLEEWLR